MSSFLTEINLPNLLLIIIGISIFLVFVIVCIVSIYEKEFLAAKRSFLISIILPLPFLIIGVIQLSVLSGFSWLLALLSTLFVVALFLPIDWKKNQRYETPKFRIDERDIMFSRRLLQKGSKRFREYYKCHPELKPLDEKFRSYPGLLKPGTLKYDSYLFNFAEATFDTIEVLKSSVDGEVGVDKVEVSAEEITRYIKSWSRYLGAVNVGITELKDYHLYSFIGRGEDYGRKINLKHKFAIAFTVEMDYNMVQNAPSGSIVMESAKEYLQSGIIAVQVAKLIRRLGYPARAHIDGNYRVICPLVAKDAGLGEVVRMGLLMTPRLGPRVRISVVTTDIPLIADQPIQDGTVLDFCNRCLKCAEACPSKSISFGDRQCYQGVERWRINSEACFTYWCIVGTDCGRCLAVCPYSHQDNFMHNFVRWGVSRSFLFRQLAIRFDDILYGKVPKQKKSLMWIKKNKASSLKSI